MKKVFVLFVLGFLLYGCGCLAQIPPQYVYADENCVATLPDYSGLVIASDNCELIEITQIPFAGVQITITTPVEMRAIDANGNISSVYFNVLLLDTIPPLIQFNPAWTGYTDKEVGNMYKTYYGWIQEKGDEYNEKVAGKTDTVYVAEWDTTYYHTYDTMNIFFGTIPITDPRFRLDQGYWSNSGPDLTAWFK